MAALAERQHGVVSLRQLRALGFGRGAIEHRLERRRLHRVHRGVYAVGHAVLTTNGRLWAAVLACGNGALVSHRSAASLWTLLPPAGRPLVDISSSRRRRSTRLINAHHAPELLEQDRARVNGIPCTSVARTLLDLADVGPPRAVERALDQAEVLRLLDLVALEDVMERANGRRGTGVLRAALREHATGPTLTRSQLEERFLALVRRAGLPRPAVNTIVCGYEVDFHWPAHRLVVEVDGAAAHLTRRAFERDRRRDAALQVAGQRVVRVTWIQITREPDSVDETLRALLGV